MPFAFVDASLDRADALRDDADALARLWTKATLIAVDGEGRALAAGDDGPWRVPAASLEHEVRTRAAARRARRRRLVRDRCRTRARRARGAHRPAQRRRGLGRVRRFAVRAGAGDAPLARTPSFLRRLRRRERLRARRLARALHALRQRTVPAHRPGGDRGHHRRRTPAARAPGRLARASLFHPRRLRRTGRIAGADHRARGPARKAACTCCAAATSPRSRGRSRAR